MNVNLHQTVFKVQWCSKTSFNQAIKWIYSKMILKLLLEYIAINCIENIYNQSRWKSIYIKLILKFNDVVKKHSFNQGKNGFTLKWF